MSRRSQLTRMTGTGGLAEFVTPSFTWNAMLASYVQDGTNASEQIELSSAQPRHTSLGLDRDFDTTDYPVVRIRIPRDGIYSMSARVAVFPASGDDDADLLGGAIIAIVMGNESSDYALVDLDRRPLYGPARLAATDVYLHASHAGYPCFKDQLVWVRLHNETNDYVVNGQLVHLSVTYEAEIGTIYDKGWN